MLDIGKEDSGKSRCYFSTTVLPQYIDDKQPPTKRKPFSTILAQPFNHTLDVIVPAAVLPKLQDRLGESPSSRLQYLRLHMKPAELITGDFFTQYIKNGNILMLSEGRAGIDTTMSLHAGVLRLELDKATYERAGLVGQPIRDHGRKHVKSRFVVELNLRLPAMVRGKKGFNRIVYAFDNVLTHSLTWLFRDLNGANDGTGPVAIHQPFVRTVEPEVLAMDRVNMPTLPDLLRESEEVEAADLLEWLRLLSLDSPRVRLGDDVDSYLCRYSVPDLVPAGMTGAKQSTMDLVRLRWHGFMSAAFVADVLSAAIKVSGSDCCALHVNSFSGKSYTILKSGSHALTWECEG